MSNKYGLKKIFLVIIFLLLSIPSFSLKQLKVDDVNIIMKRFFEYHIDKKELTPQIMKRMIKVYINQFDSEKIYLLQTEVNPYLNLSEKEVKNHSSKLIKGDLSLFIELNKIFEKSIVRARYFRDVIENEYLNNEKSIKTPKKPIFAVFANSEKDLINRNKYKISKFYLYQRKNFKLDNISKKQKVVNLLEKRLKRYENKYYFEKEKKNANKQQHVFVLHLLKSFAKSLDAHSTFFSEEEAVDMRMSLEKQFEGIGVVLTDGVEGVIISDLIPGSPATKSEKIEINDIIYKIDGKSIKNLDFDEVMQLMKKEKDEKITLGIKRVVNNGKENRFDVILAREAISMDEERLKYESVPYSDGIIGTLQLPSFYENHDGVNSAKDIRNAIDELQKKGNLKGLILDLRDNSGGFLTQAVKVASIFLDNGIIVMSKYSNGEIRYLRNFGMKKKYSGPLIVLTSRLSASASEIVAQALQDYGVALIVGDDRTFGKGSIQYQTVTDEKADVFFKVTVGKYYTVSGKTTQIDGVKADITVPSNLYSSEFGERYLDYPLDSDRISAAYTDSLEDLDIATRWWFRKNYIPHQQTKVKKWTSLLPVLKANSKYRCDKNPDVQVFVREHKKTPVPKNSCDIYGLEDVQMTEAVNVMKDMILIKTQNIEKISNSK
jgi:carboxyl-terminal processing protease